MKQKIKAFIGILLMRFALLWDRVTTRKDGRRFVEWSLKQYLKERYPLLTEAQLDDLFEINLPTILNALNQWSLWS